MNQIHLMKKLHTGTSRDYLSRMIDEKVTCMKIAKNYGQEYWDGSRRQGYGGYSYDGRWEAIAKELIKRYNLNSTSRILDIGCGKGYLLFELKKLLSCEVVGFDISEYAIQNAKPEIQSFLRVQKADEPYDIENKYFDLVISIMTLHNLPLHFLEKSLKEIERVGKQKYITIESFRNEDELFNLQCWALTAESFLSPKSWQWVFNNSNFTGDYELMYFE